MNVESPAESLPEVKRKRTRSASPPYISALDSLIRAPPPVTPNAPRRLKNRGKRRRNADGMAATRPVCSLDSDSDAIVSGRSKFHAGPKEEVTMSRSRPVCTPNTERDKPVATDSCLCLSRTDASGFRALDSFAEGSRLSSKTQLPDCGSGIFLLNREIAVTGTADVKVLRGAVTVLSHVLTAQSRRARIHSALGPFVITLLPVSATDGEDRPRRPVLQRGVEVLVKKLSTGSEGPFAVVEISAVVDDKDRASECIAPFVKYIALPLHIGARAADTRGSSPRQMQDYVEELVPGFWISGTVKPPKFSQWNEWPSVVNALSFKPESSDASHDQRIIVCGESGTGKSMLARCVVNHLLNTWNSIVYAETDVGQPELTPAGLVSVHVLSSPLLGPPASHNRIVPLHSLFFGEVTPRENPSGYALATSKIIEIARSYAFSHKIPLVCNSDGWVSGTGARLLDHVVGALEPTHVFCSSFSQIQSSSSDHRAPLPEVLRVTLGRVSENCSAQVESPLTAKECIFSSSALRDLGFAAYFGAELVDGAVRSVKLEDINVVFIGEAVPGTHILGALNGSVIALASTLGKAHSFHWRVFGLGLVRAVDPIDHTLHVCTPLPDDILARCDGLLMSSGIQAPALLYYACAKGVLERSTDAQPYLTKLTAGKFGAMRSRTTLRR